MSLHESLSWTEFMEEYLEMLSTEYYGETYPQLELELSNCPNYNEYMMKFVENAIKNEPNLQLCLNQLLDTILDGSRYAKDDLQIIFMMIDKFLEHGVGIPERKLFGERYESSDHASLEDEIEDYYIRAKLIDKYSDKINVNSWADWREIEAKYPDETILFNRKYTENDRYSVLKYYSDYLKKINNIVITI